MARFADVSAVSSAMAELKGYWDSLLGNFRLSCADEKLSRMVNISQAILGIKPTLEGLSVEPCLPSELNEYTVCRRYRGAMYEIHVRRTGKAEMLLDGAAVQGKCIPIVPGKEYYRIEVTV